MTVLEDTGAPIPVLVVSYIFLPVGEVGAKRIGKFCRYFPDTGIRPIVLTAQERFYKFQDQSVRPPAGIRIERTTVWPTPLDLYKKLREGRSSRNSSSAEAGSGVSQREVPSGWLKRHLLALLQTPDPYWGWYAPAVREGNRLIREERVKAILSTGPPWISHLVARHLKKKHRLPWLADFRDPWAFDPHIQLQSPSWKLWLDEQAERACIRLADRVLCNTERQRRLFLERFPTLDTTKFVTITNGFDEVQPPPRESEAVRRRRLVHLGSLYSQRRVDTFCQAVSQLTRAGTLASPSVEVLFIGDADPNIIREARARVPGLIAEGTIRFCPRVDWTEAQKMLWSADVLLLFQGNLRLEVPAKLFEYLPTGKPILGVAKPGALTDILDEGMGVWADVDDPAEIADKIILALNRKPLSPSEAQARWSHKYHFRALTREVADHIRAVTPGA